LYVDVVFDVVSERALIPRAELLAPPFDSGKWDSQSSGTSIESAIARKLEGLWTARTRSRSKAARQGEDRDESPEPKLDEDALQDLLDLDAKYQVQGRKEQARVRRLLLGSKNVAACAFCQQSFPVDLLVAAHIKRRADCSQIEKKDFKNNVILLCKFGCDDLFERGYIVVKRGKVDFGRPASTPAVATKVSFMRGKPVRCWGDDSAHYFAAHHKRATESEDD
jgi:hypothetical protein